MFILLDGRAKSGNDEDASVLDTADNEEEAVEAGSQDWAGFDAIWYEYEKVGNKLLNGKPRWDLPPCGERE